MGRRYKEGRRSGRVSMVQLIPGDISNWVSPRGNSVLRAEAGKLVSENVGTGTSGCAYKLEGLDVGRVYHVKLSCIADTSAGSLYVRWDSNSDLSVGGLGVDSVGGLLEIDTLVVATDVVMYIGALRTGGAVGSYISILDIDVVES